MEERKLRIKIEDLPKDMKITPEEMRRVLGGIGTVPLPDKPTYYSFIPIWKRYGESGGGCGCGCG